MVCITIRSRTSTRLLQIHLPAEIIARVTNTVYSIFGLDRFQLLRVGRSIRTLPLSHLSAAGGQVTDGTINTPTVERDYYARCHRIPATTHSLPIVIHCTRREFASVIQWSDLVAARSEVPGSIPGATRFSE
jgi:hypothetical protein